MPSSALRICLGLSVCSLISAAEYDLPASPATVAWGYYSAQAKPVLTVHSGDTVRIHTVSTCALDRMEEKGVPHDAIPQYDRDIHDGVPDKGPGGHILTGPVAISEAEPGDVLEIDIQKIDIDVPYACNGFGAGRGFLPNDILPYASDSARSGTHDRKVRAWD